MQSSKLLFALCETVSGGKQFICYNGESVESEDGTFTAFMHDLCYQLTAGRPSVGAYYLFSEVPLQEHLPDVVYSNLCDDGRTSMFGYLIDDVTSDSQIM